MRGERTAHVWRHTGAGYLRAAVFASIVCLGSCGDDAQPPRDAGHVVGQHDIDAAMVTRPDSGARPGLGKVRLRVTVR